MGTDSNTPTARTGNRPVKRGVMQPHHNPDMRMLLAGSYDEQHPYQGMRPKVRLNHRHANQANAG
jgi:hypothetical protein